LCIFLHENGYKVTGLDISKPLNDDIFYNFHLADMRNFEWNSLKFNDFHAVIHLAALTSVSESFNKRDEYFDINVNCTNDLFFHCNENGIKKVIFASSAACYGNSEKDIKIIGEEFSPESPYAITKLEGEKLALKYTTETTNFICLRFFNVYGPHQSVDSSYAAVIPNFINQIHNNLPITIYGNGSQTRDFIHVSDIIKSIIKIMNTPDKVPYLLNLGTGNGVSIKKLADTVLGLSHHYGGKSFLQYLPERKGDVLYSISDISELSKWIDINEFLPLDMGIRELFERGA
jgi:UDP-glucose 4-epimerase